MANRKLAAKVAKSSSSRPGDTDSGSAGGDFGALAIEARRAKGDAVALEETVRAGVKRARVTTQTMLDRYLQREQISQRQFDAGERLHRLWRVSGSAPTVVASYGLRVSGGGDITQRQAALRADVTSALLAVGNRMASILVHVCLCDEAAGDWGERHRGRAGDGISVLRLALDSLADHWGL